MRSLVLRVFLGCMHGAILPLLAQTALNPEKPDSDLPDNVRFVALEEHERRGAVLDIRNRLLFERTEKTKRAQAIAECDTAFRMTVQLTDDMQQLTNYIRIHKNTRDILSDIAGANNRQLELIDLIDSAIRAGSLPPQVANFLLDAKKQVNELGKRQVDRDKQLRTFLKTIETAIRNVPPPAHFVSSSGIPMQLYRLGSNSFYASQFPITVAQYNAITKMQAGQDVKPAPADGYMTNISLPEANAFCRILSRIEGFPYQLPDTNQLTFLSRNQAYMNKDANTTAKNTSCALWINTPWTPKNLDAQRANEQFEMTFFTVWDPYSLLNSGDVFGELPFARYPQLGFAVVTSAQTGWLLRWQRLMKTTPTDIPFPRLDDQDVPAP